ncbi:LuxR family transcriptional regulator [Candidatus Contubernalis alkaliaceticus]|uniref:LuxR family transcriptional regulator n=1 Tax=Candidatus Contubernalis alkaliaceticus TaxID=338645 RepID=UPI001F4BFABB|nr:LuxR family transcriptional regulator [Candidatus Contubernalis alkalaceticus]UNC91372.1 hypothetical protein HUE98_04265 [Candidatus Contubernalis alkalaceticus]
MKAKSLTMWSLAVFFGWLLSFPFNGPVFQAVIFNRALDGALGLYFTFFHALGLFAAAFLFRGRKLVKGLMVLSGALCLILTVILWFSSVGWWPFWLSFLGAASSFYIIGWGYRFTYLVTNEERLKFMAVVIILSNLFYVIINIVSAQAPAYLVYILSMTLLTASLCFAAALEREDIESCKDIKLDGQGEKQCLKVMDQLKEFPNALMIILTLFIFGLYINGGFMYSVIYPTFAEFSRYTHFFRVVPYLAVLLVMWKFGGKVHRKLPVYLGASMLGLAFISFALLSDSLSGYIITEILIESAFGLLDLFIWTFLGVISLLYGTPYRMFGYGLSANVFAIFLGEVMGVRLMLVGEQYPMITAIFAASTIFLTFIIVPWLNDQMDRELLENTKDVGKKVYEKKVDAFNMDRFLEEKQLTPREREILTLLFKGETNKVLAEQLFISENTLKTHLKNIYKKLGVSNKRELLSMVIRGEDKELQIKL